MSEATAFWQGEFGDDYHRRQTVTVDANEELFRWILSTIAVHSIAELGAGAGLNLRALRNIADDFDLCGVEVNASAVSQLLKIPGVVGVQSSVAQWTPARKFDLTFTKGLLIHIPPDELPETYDRLVNASSRYVMICEYFNPIPVEVVYRGIAGRLWKRDFADEIMRRHPMRLVDYGFVYHRDTLPQDNVTWFLMEKMNGI